MYIRDKRQIKISLDSMMNDMPKMFRMADDMHELTSYINDMRIVMIAGAVLGAIAGIAFLIFKVCFRQPPKENLEFEDDPRRGTRLKSSGQWVAFPPPPPPKEDVIEYPLRLKTEVIEYPVRPKTIDRSQVAKTHVSSTTKNTRRIAEAEAI